MTLVAVVIIAAKVVIGVIVVAAATTAKIATRRAIATNKENNNSNRICKYCFLPLVIFLATTQQLFFCLIITTIIIVVIIAGIWAAFCLWTVLCHAVIPVLVMSLKCRSTTIARRSIYRGQSKHTYEFKHIYVYINFFLSSNTKGYYSVLVYPL